MCSGEKWGEICTDHWDNNDASVVCRQLGYSPYGNVNYSDSFNKCHLGSLAYQYQYSYYTNQYTKVLRGVNCVGNESSIHDCPTNSSASCGYYYYSANVICPGIR